MRIVRDASQEIEKKVVCKNCGVELGYLPIDVTETRYKDIDGGSDTEKSITCINCHKKIVVY